MSRLQVEQQRSRAGGERGTTQPDMGLGCGGTFWTQGQGAGDLAGTQRARGGGSRARRRVEEAGGGIYLMWANSGELLWKGRSGQQGLRHGRGGTGAPLSRASHQGWYRRSCCQEGADQAGLATRSAGTAPRG